MKTTPLIEPLILSIRRQRVMLAADLAKVYGVDTRTLNQAVKRNAKRFPGDFVFQLTHEEFESLRSQNAILTDGRTASGLSAANLKSQSVISSWGGARRSLPYAFTEHGAIMAAMVLNSRQAVAMSVYVVRAFTRMREQLTANAIILKRLAEIDKALLQHDSALRDIYRKLLPLLQPPSTPPKRRIGFIADDE